MAIEGADISTWLKERTAATLELEDGTSFDGFSFGAPTSIAGEVCFNTGMVGYPESLSDPSYRGQILVLTFPLVGNYGVPADEKDSLGLAKYFESDNVHVKAVVVSDYSFISSHYTATRTLAAWLKEKGVPGIYGVDTRAVTKLVRDRGATLGKVIIQGSTPAASLPFDNPNSRNLSVEVCRKEKTVFNPPAGPAPGADLEVNAQMPSGAPVHILAVDCGMKNNIVRYLVNVLRVKVTSVPWDYDFTKDEFDGLFLSNGPGDPTKCEKTIEHVRTLMQRSPTVPIFGICLGNQILALAAGAKTYKMKFGNRGMNQPVVDCEQLDATSPLRTMDLRLTLKLCRLDGCNSWSMPMMEAMRASFIRSSHGVLSSFTLKHVVAQWILVFSSATSSRASQIRPRPQ